MQNLRMEPMQTDENNNMSEKAFTEVFDIEGGTQPPKSDFIYEPKSGYIRLLQIRDFGQHPVPTYIPLTKKLKLCNVTDILIGRYGASVGKICTGMEGAYNVALTKVVPLKKMDSRYIYHLLNSNYFQAQLRRIERSAQNGFNKDDLSSIFLPVIDDYDNQVKISNKLDLLITEVRNSKLKIDNAKKVMDKFRQAVLTAAVTGKLTEDWRMQYDVDLDQWERTTLNEYVQSFQNGLSKRQADEGENTVVLRLADVKANQIIENDFRYIKLSEKEKDKYNLVVNDILITRVNGSPQIVGGFTLINKENNWAYCDHFIRLRLKQGVYSKFVFYLSQTPAVRNHINQNMVSSAGQNTINQETVKSIPVNIPSFDEQVEIVKIIDQYFRIAEKIEQNVGKAEEKVSKLTQAILAKTFRAEL